MTPEITLEIGGSWDGGMKGRMYKTGKMHAPKVQGLRKKTLLRNFRGVVQFSLVELGAGW